MEIPSPSHHPRLAWLALATLGVLLLLPSTRYLLRMQLQAETLELTAPGQANPSAERAAAAQLPNDYPVQLALAAITPNSFAVSTDADPMAQTKARNRRIAALAQQFPNNPSVYANLMRYMTLGEMHLRRNDDGSLPVPADKRTILCQTSPESFEMFDAAAQKGAQLDPDNAYFPMMRAIGLFDAGRDAEALEALKAAGRCSHWTEYFQDDVDGQNRLQTATYGERGALARVNNAANLLFPHYASLRAVARRAMYLAEDKELYGDADGEEGIAIRHALMRCGGLMRSQGTSYITSLVGIAITNIGTADPGGTQIHAKLTSGQNTGEEAERLRAERLQRYYAYLENLGQWQEAEWARSEIAASEQARAIGAEGIQGSVFNSRNFTQIGYFTIANLALLSSMLVLLVLGVAAYLAGSIRPKRALLVWRTAYALLVLGGIGLWQWHAARVGMAPFVALQNMWCGFTGNTPNQDNGFGLQSFTAAVSLLVPALFVGLIAAITLFQRVPLSTGMGRGLRGVAIPAAVAFFAVYGVSLAPTAYLESVIKADVVRTTHNEPQRYAEITGKPWPGDPLP